MVQLLSALWGFLMHTASRLSVLALLFAAGSANAQYDWINPISSTWNSGLWDAPAPPAPQFPNSDTANATISGAGMPYTVSVSNGNWAVNNVTKLSSDATLQLNRTLQLYGNFVNEGATVVAAPSTGGANLRFRGSGARSITGNGTITLASNATSDQSATIDRSAFDTTEVTISPTQTITGTGRITVPFVNQGTISATGGGTITINTSNDLAINNGIIEANTGGTLRLVDVTLDCQNISTIDIDAGTLEFNGQTFSQRIKDATVVTTNGGIMRSTQGNADLDNVILNGDADGGTRDGYRFYGSFFENNGTMTLTGDGVNGFSALRIDATPYTFNGTGEIVMLHPAMTNPGAAPAIIDSIGGAVLTNGINHTLRGKYRVVTEMINQGTMIADATGESVDLIARPMENQGILRATNGGILKINNDTTQTGAGVIELDGGFLDAIPIGGGIASLTGNSVVGTNGGKVRLMDGNLAVTNVTFNSDADILGQQLRSLGSNVNNGSMLLQLDGGNFGVLQFNGAQTWDGTGEIILNADSDSLLRYAQLTRGTAGDEIIHVATHTIRGTGEINAAIDNRGLMTADVPARTMIFQNDDKKNTGTIRADQGIISIFSVTVDQTDPQGGLGGTIEAVNGGEIRFLGPEIIGGTIDATGGLAQTTSGTTRFHGIELRGQLDLIPSGDQAFDTLTNNGLIVVNAPRGGGARQFDLGPGCVVDGTGIIRLNTPGSPSGAQLTTTTNAVESVTSGPGHTIEGTGTLVRLDLTNQGTLSPGFDGVIDPAIGIFEMSLTSIMCEPTSTVVIEIEGAAATEHDRIVNIGAADTSFHCAGKLALSNINGYGGLAPGEFIDIVIAPLGVTGTFDTVTYPGVLNYEVLYLPDRVRVAYDCIADTNNDGSVTPTDFTAWVNAFNNNLPECDQNGDGACTPTDFTAWIANFNAGC